MSSVSGGGFFHLDLLFHLCDPHDHVLLFPPAPPRAHLLAGIHLVLKQQLPDRTKESRATGLHPVSSCAGWADQRLLPRSGVSGDTSDYYPPTNPVSELLGLA